MNDNVLLNSYIEQINQTLETLIPEKEVPHASLFEAARYSLIGPGKRIRPLLTLAAVESLGGTVEGALVPACAIELIHTYSLIHDDLPCMDDDDFRRGKPSLHKVYPEGHALLTGDFLLTHAFDVLAHAPHLSPEQRVSLIAILSRYAGGDGMVGGQTIDLQKDNASIKLEDLQLMHKMKTGGLITASLEFGAVIANTPEKQPVLRDFGQIIGLAFQIVDDILDHHEKNPKKDHAEAPNYVSLLGLKKAKLAAQESLQMANQKLKALPGDTAFLEKLAHLIVNRQQ